MKTVRTIILLLGMAFTPLALADDQVNGVGTVYWHTTQAITNTSACITDDDGRCALFPAGTIDDHKQKVITIVLEGDDEVTCAWVGNGAVTLAGAVVTETGGEFGRNGVGLGATFRLVPSADPKYDSKPSRRQHLKARAVGTWRGLCEAPTFSAGEMLHATCKVTNDCTPYGGGACITRPTSAQQTFAGMKLVCESDGAGPEIISIKKEWVQKEPPAQPSE